MPKRTHHKVLAKSDLASQFPYVADPVIKAFITIGGTAGVDPATGVLAGPDVAAQTVQILDSFRVMFESVGSDLEHVVHITIFLKDMRDFDERSYWIPGS